MGRRPKFDRNEKILAMRLSGVTYKEIASAFGITKGRAFQICKYMMEKRGG
jgi:DNA-binding CsgD family transcriptional regulator